MLFCNSVVSRIQWQFSIPFLYMSDFFAYTLLSQSPKLLFLCFKEQQQQKKQTQKNILLSGVFDKCIEQPHSLSVTNLFIFIFLSVKLKKSSCTWSPSTAGPLWLLINFFSIVTIGWADAWYPAVLWSYSTLSGVWLEPWTPHYNHLSYIANALQKNKAVTVSHYTRGLSW